MVSCPTYDTAAADVTSAASPCLTHWPEYQSCWQLIGYHRCGHWLHYCYCWGGGGELGELVDLAELGEAAEAG